jgi:hypothetical protein
MSNATLTYICANGHRWLSPKCFCGLTAELENLSKPVKGSPIAKPKGNKYGAKKVVVDGIPFDSTVEGARYLQLRAQEKGGIISGLYCQHPIAIRGENGAKIGLYWADFVYFDALGEEIIEDVKGVLSAVFKLKRKTLAAQGVIIDVVKREDIPVEFLHAAAQMRDCGVKRR